MAISSTHCLCISHLIYFTYFSQILFSGFTFDPDIICIPRPLGRGRYNANFINSATCVECNGISPALNFLQNLTTALFIGEVLEDYPDSPGLGDELTTEAASNILDSEDAMDTAGPSLRRDEQHSFRSHVDESRVCTPKRRNEDCTSRSDCASAVASAVPMLPPIYHSIAKKRLSKTILRHLDGSKETECTTLGASVSQTLQVGSFNNIGDRRHNGTIHQHDHTTTPPCATSAPHLIPTHSTAPLARGGTRYSTAPWRELTLA